MLFAVDIGNTNIVLALNDGEGWVDVWRMHTDAKKTSDEYFFEINEIFLSIRKDVSVDRAIVSSVVPSLTMVFEKVCFRIFGIKALVVSSRVRNGLDLSTIPEEMGSDLIADLVAGHMLFPDDDVVVLDFGTAFTISCVSREGGVRGVAIAPGLITSVNALAGNTAALPYIELKTPDAVLGRNSIQAIRSGIMYGFAGLAESMISRIEKETGRTVKVVATGGLCQTIGPLISRVDHIDKNHTLNGLKIISDLNQG